MIKATCRTHDQALSLIPDSNPLRLEVSDIEGWSVHSLDVTAFSCDACTLNKLTEEDKPTIVPQWHFELVRRHVPNTTYNMTFEK